ncbi:hypothetical protein AGABI1DRAFT_77775 [Agaricus bisporus var. burnettii JB137-S8]|uniref:E3 ubiquitin-protein ligase n=1 Tax=Agaricus bisporus var. burnettii (strain JB137-S8 / ATCC MYA-4627 / FGSC 10392) TaxID=597362 RepID=K5WNT0_AGABU|nr:uncharacterized protein AGABI1DRAFT_77775 [Agaricus bisporus var. burnettii JB137-S8]EKM76991.1 hypothetical protein AGABI1DRAFT_77775 [Agaricus bisporus var. burnettii JB137-S8]
MRRPQATQPDQLADLRFALEVMPGSRKYVFTPAARAEILAKLYSSFMGNHPHLFLGGSGKPPQYMLLSEYQASVAATAPVTWKEKAEAVIPGRPCTYIFKKGECCFRCKDCSLDDSCVLCARCFHATDHSDHNVSFFIAQQPGGTCDCGDEEAWRNSLGCPHHPPSPYPEEPAEVFKAGPRVASRPMPRDIPPVPNYPFRVQIPDDLRAMMHRTIGFALDYILDTMDYSPDEPGPPIAEGDLRLQPTADPMTKDQYCVVVWNDDKHCYDELIKMLCDLTNRTREESLEVIQKIDDIGREIIDMNTNVPKLYEMAMSIAQIDLGVTIRRAFDTFCEQVVSVLIEWLADLTKCHVDGDAMVIKEIIAAELLSHRRKEMGYPINTRSPLYINDPSPARIDALFLYHTRLWKKPRLYMKEVYATVTALSLNHKLAIAGHFANVYHRVIDAYLLVDREAETSIKYFALQLFTSPSVAGHIVKNHGLISRLLNIISSFFTNQIAEKHIQYQTSYTGPLDVESYPFKSKRFMPVFSDLRYLCHTEPVQEMIARNRDFIVQFAKTCQLFMCVNPNKRAVMNHVEYETDAWISVFNVTLSLSRVIKVFGEAFVKANASQLVTAIRHVIHVILLVVTLAEDRLDKAKFTSTTFHRVEFGESSYNIVKFDVLEGWVSFHHSLHWLLAELLKHTQLLSPEALTEVGCEDLRGVFLERATEQAVLTIVDFPLRVLAMVAQIRTGLWVRNGFAVRGQLLHYRDYMLRELCYDQDLYILQTSLILMDPDIIFVTILDRFGLRDYFSGITTHDIFEPQQLSSMVEEVLYVLIVILSEDASAQRLSVEGSVRREIVHALAMGPCTFSDLVKRVAERLVDDVCFERMLSQVAHFKPPETATDSGLYELKDEVYDEVNPFFYHYTRNKREEVENVLKMRLRKRLGVQDPVIVPKKFGVEGGLFGRLTEAFEKRSLVQIMFYSLENVLRATEVSGMTPPSAEAILDQALQLVMLAVVERGERFAEVVVGVTFDGGAVNGGEGSSGGRRTLMDVVCALEFHDKYKLYHSRVGWILDELEKYVPEDIRKRRVVPDRTSVTRMSTEETKKRAAKARQEAIMQQMKAQQASFAVNFDDAGDDEDEDMEEVDEEHQHTTFGTCIVCQEDLNSSRGFGALSLIQPSRLIRKQPDIPSSYLNEVLQMPSTLDRAPPTLPIKFPPTQKEIQEASKQNMAPNFEGFSSSYTKFGLYGSVCTHMMHLECFQVYSVSIRQRHRSQATRNHPESIPRKEYICPLCKSLGNVILPVTNPNRIALNTVPFTDWIRAAGISILKSKPDQWIEALQFRNGTGEFSFWAVQDPHYTVALRNPDRWNDMDTAKMLDTLMSVCKSFSQQTRHLRDRPEPEVGDRGSGIYLPEELIGYTIAGIEVAQRGVNVENGGLVADNLTEAQMRMIRGLLMGLTTLAAIQFKAKGRPDETCDAIRQAIIKRLLPEWSRITLTSFSYPLLLRDPFTLLVETAAVAPEIIKHILVLTYYACLARTAIGLIYILTKTRSFNTPYVSHRGHEDIFGDVRMFFMSVVRHSPIFEHTAMLAFESFGEARIDKLLYQFTLPFLRRAAILCRSILPSSFPTPPALQQGTSQPDEYKRLLDMLGIPPLAELPRQDTLQNALSGWCAHYGHSQAASQLNCGVVLEYPTIYRMARLPVVLDSLFGQQDKALTCQRCNTVPMDAAICLICGATCCFQSYCCTDIDYNERGECNMHTRECGGMIGVYFLVKRCSLLFLNAGNGTFALAPYMDANGEVDISMRRGRRQFLHPARWEDVRKTWLNHGVPTIVARKLEATIDPGGWETF